MEVLFLEAFLFLQEIYAVAQIIEFLSENKEGVTKGVMIALVAWYNLRQKDRKAKKKNASLEKRLLKVEKHLRMSKPRKKKKPRRK